MFQNLPTMHENEFFGNTLQRLFFLFFIILFLLFKCFALSRLEDQSRNFSKISRISSNNNQRNWKQTTRCWTNLKFITWCRDTLLTTFKCIALHQWFCYFNQDTLIFVSDPNPQSWSRSWPEFLWINNIIIFLYRDESPHQHHRCQRSCPRTYWMTMTMRCKRTWWITTTTQAARGPGGQQKALPPRDSILGAVAEAAEDLFKAYDIGTHLQLDFYELLAYVYEAL